MRRRTFAAVAALTLATLAAGGPIAATAGPPVTAPGAADADDTALAAALDQVLTDSRLNGALESMQVRDGATGAVIYSRNADERVIPASNEKLMTAAAALEVLGTDFTFHTKVHHSGARTRGGGTVNGNLYLQGFGDPTLTEAAYDELAATVAATGITRFTGQLVGVDSWFDRVPLGLDWSWEDETYAYSAPVSALSAAATADYDTGSVAVHSRPGAQGQPAQLSMAPRNTYVNVVNQTTTGAAGSADTVTAVREHGTNTVRVTGSVPLNASSAGVDLVSVEDPSRMAVSVFRAALARRGVTVAGGDTLGTVAAGSIELADRVSMPLSRLLTPFLKLSNNGHAEVLIKSIGRVSNPTRPGSWSTGLAAANTALAGLGVDTAVVRLGDGSGLSRRDLLTTRQIGNLLHAAQSEHWFPIWYDALPVAGDPNRLVGGTLTSRMRNTPAALNLRAKTGSMTGVNALSGYVNDTDGRRLIFAIVANNQLSSVTSMLDSAGVTLAGSGSTSVRAARRAEAPVPAAVNREGEEVECSWVLAC